MAPSHMLAGALFPFLQITHNIIDDLAQIINYASMTTKKFDLQKLLNFIKDDPYKEAQLVCSVPLKFSTLQRIKSGSYKPSAILGNAIMAVIEREEK